MRVWRLSDAYIGPKSRTERPRKTEIGKEVAHVTHDSDTTSKVKRSKVNLQGRGGGLPLSMFLLTFRTTQYSSFIWFLNSPAYCSSAQKHWYNKVLFRLSHASLAKFCSVVWRSNTPFQYFSLTWSDIFNRTSFDNFYIRGILVFVPTSRSLLSCSFGHRRYSLPLLCFLLYAYTTFWVIVIKRRKDRGKKHNFLRKKKN